MTSFSEVFFLICRVQLGIGRRGFGVVISVSDIISKREENQECYQTLQQPPHNFPVELLRKISHEFQEHITWSSSMLQHLIRGWDWLKHSFPHLAYLIFLLAFSFLSLCPIFSSIYLYWTAILICFPHWTNQLFSLITFSFHALKLGTT